MMIGCSEGGTSIEDLAEKFPDKIVKIPVDINRGLTDEQAAQMVDGLAVTGDREAAKEQIKALYRTFTECDCTMVEVSCCLPVGGLGTGPHAHAPTASAPADSGRGAEGGRSPQWLSPDETLIPGQPW